MPVFSAKERREGGRKRASEQVSKQASKQETMNQIFSHPGISSVILFVSKLNLTSVSLKKMRKIDSCFLVILNKYH